jgi:hypothetical protein
MKKILTVKSVSRISDLLKLVVDFSENGALAQMGERMTGSHEVNGSIPLCSTNLPSRFRAAFSFNTSIYTLLLSSS